MKKLTLALALTALAVLSMPASAVSLPNNFNVQITLTSKCEVVTAPSNIDLAYTSFQTTAASNTTSLVFRCTNTFPISSIALDATAGGGAGGATITDSVTDLNYTVALTGVPAAGTGNNQTVTITANIPANQAGTCAAATCTNAAATNRQRTITLTY